MRRDRGVLRARGLPAPCSSVASPVPSTASCAGSDTSASSVARIRSMPFWCARRLTTPSSGTSARSQLQRRLYGALVDRACARDSLPCSVRADNGSVAGFHTAVSMPFRMPCRRAGAMAHQSVESMAVLRCLNFARIRRAHRRDAIGERDPAFDERHRAVEFEPVDRPQIAQEVRVASNVARSKMP